MTVNGPGKAAEQAEEKKRNHYNELSRSYHFEPIASETMGAWAPSSHKFISDLGNRIRAISAV